MTFSKIGSQPQEKAKQGPSIINFADEASGEIAISSTWKSKRSTQQQGCQTIPIKTESIECQSFRMVDEECQTIPEPERRFRLLKEFNYDSLCGFLDYVEPMVSRELIKNAKSSAFDGYTVNWDDEVSTVSCLFTLENGQKEEDAACTDISWNKNGTIVGAAYGRYDHVGWCTHKGFLCCWNLSLRDVNPSYASFRTETPTCLMAIAFHPESPNLVVGGTFNGEVIVWSLNEVDDLVIAMSKMSESTHQEPISKAKQISTWEPASRAVSAVEWSPFKPTVFSVSSADGNVHFYNLTANRSLPVFTLKVSENKDVGCTSSSFNFKRADMFATGDSTGILKIWKLTTALTSVDAIEDRFLRLLGDLKE
ncbi:WD repeat-containing protein 34 [Phlyctochytrium planicorne]|nr:WD repeat-containing protein 34 [Phlyctochytrium planicorne]